MKYIRLGYIEENKWETMSEGDRNSMMDECFAYDDVLKASGGVQQQTRRGDLARCRFWAPRNDYPVERTFPPRIQETKQ